MKIVIPGHPIPKARARVTRKGFAYDPQDKIKKETQKYLKQELEKFFAENENRIEGYKLAHGEAFEVDWYFHMPIPKSFNKSKANACKWGFIQHISKPDRSNIEKFYEDCANGILWRDDSQITTGQIIKKYCSDDKPRTEIHLKIVEPTGEDIQEILSMFSPEEISTICFDASRINFSKEGIPKIAVFMSKLADNFSPRLSKINKKYPGYWKKFESNSIL